MPSWFAVSFDSPPGGFDDEAGLFGPVQETIYVIAADYNQAVSKATIWAETRQEKSGIFTKDGSLDFSKIENRVPRISSVRIAPSTVLW